LALARSIETADADFGARYAPAVKQVVLRSGQPQVVEVPAPARAPGFILVANAASAISSGTERAAVSFDGGSLPMRAIQNPGLVLQAMRHAREHGIRETAQLARETVAADVALGYSSAGTVLDTGGVASFTVGQRVACAGAGRASHAEVVSVPANLVVPVPDGVSLRDASLVAIGAISLQGVRRAEAELGERVVVVGLGLLGLLSVQLLRAAGCQVVGVEPQERRRSLGLELGAEQVVTPDEAVALVQDWSDGIGADAVIVTAASSSSAIVNQAVSLVRRKGRVIPVGDVGLDLERPPLYEREADVLISTSYGPGRYDATYEEQGLDYPIAYVRWTEGRNMREFLRLIGSGKLKVEPLVDVELPAERAPEAYAALRSDEPPLAAVLTYDRDSAEQPPSAPAPTLERARQGDVVVAIVGTGSFLKGTHLPNLKNDGHATIKWAVSRRGTAAAEIARSLPGVEPASDWQTAVDDPQVELVLVATRHDTHAEIAAAALRAGKSVFLEKPLGLSRDQIDDVWAAGAGDPRLVIGFNRPFAPLATRLIDEVGSADGPTQLIYRVNAPLTPEHWLNDPLQGGGRILGEACHMFDFANVLCGTPQRVLAAALPAPPGVPTVESASVTIQYADGSLASVHYSGVGSPTMPKERVEVLRGGASWILDDFVTLTSFDGRGSRTESEKRQDKGHAALLTRALAACRGEAPYEPGLQAAYSAQSVALAALESIASGAPAEVVWPARSGA
jgi:predicted dehydrogenase/threonine dehydrogenase-like Zn-dependent dehydrogenase